MNKKIKTNIIISEKNYELLLEYGTCNNKGINTILNHNYFDLDIQEYSKLKLNLLAIKRQIKKLEIDSLVDKSEKELRKEINEY